MSHVSTIEMEINDLSALIKACQSMGFEFMENQKTYIWYGKLVTPDLYPLPEGMTENDLGKCDHAIRILGAKYEIGIIKRSNKYMLLADFWDRSLKRAIGEDGGLLKQAYAVERIKREAKLKRYRINQTQINKGIRLTLTV